MNSEETNLQLKTELFKSYKRSDKKQIWIVLVGYLFSFFSGGIIFYLGKLIKIKSIIDYENQINNFEIKDDYRIFVIPMIFFGTLNTFYLIKERKKMKKIGLEIDMIEEELTNFYYIEYRNSLLGNDKKDALEKGRKYYSFKRGGHLSIYDESALTNDLETMK